MKFAIALSAGLALGLAGLTAPANAACTTVGNKIVCPAAPMTIQKGGSAAYAPAKGGVTAGQVLKPNPSLVAAGGGNLVAAGGGNFKPR